MAIGTNPGGGTLSGRTAVAAVNGAAVFSDLGIDKPGNGYTLVANASGLTSATSRSFNVTAPAVRLVFTVQPSNTLPGAAIQPPVKVMALDSLGNTATAFTGLVTIAIGNNGRLLVPATLHGTTTVANGQPLRDILGPEHRPAPHRVHPGGHLDWLDGRGKRLVQRSHTSLVAVTDR